MEVREEGTRTMKSNRDQQHNKIIAHCYTQRHADEHTMKQDSHLEE